METEKTKLPPSAALARSEASERTGVSLFFDRKETWPAPDLPADLLARSQMRTVVLEEILKRSLPPPRWGLNE
jgi:hypothetical protein